jgi:hypothetical protein
VVDLTGGTSIVLDNIGALEQLAPNQADGSWKYSTPGFPVVRVGSADDMTYSSPSRATPTASATASKSPATKSTGRATRGAAARAGGGAAVVDLTGGAFTDLAVGNVCIRCRGA